MSRTVRIGVDVGGTFTDLVLHDEARDMTWAGKLPTTPHAAQEAIIEGITRLLAESATTPGQVGTVLHGTTLVTNTLLERTGARVGLLTTAGFADVLEMARETRFDTADLHARPAAPLVPRHLRRGVGGRIGADGTEWETLDDAEILAAVESLLDQGVEALAVSLLHSYRNPGHELRARELIAGVHPDLPVTLSSEVAPVIGEYERTSTVCLNAYVRPLMSRYLDDLRAGLRAMGIDASLRVMLSSGGVTTLADAKMFPVRLLESGPAAGAIAAAAVARSLGEQDVLSFDMGGTTAKIAIIGQGRPQLAHDFEAGRVDKFKPGSGLPVRITVVDMIEIGSGGGSIAAPDSLGLLKVGPRSAGSVPGPVAYGRGGADPTVTDADLLLGCLDANGFLGGEMVLRTGDAERAIRTRLAEPLRLSTADAAAGVVEVVNESMAAAARMHVSEHGRDPADFALLAFGGAGPVHAYAMARILKIRRIIIPMRAGVMSAYGFLVAEPTVNAVRSLPSVLPEVDWQLVTLLYEDLAAGASSILTSAELSDARIRRTADMRYLGQGSAIEVPLPEGPLDKSCVPAVEKAFTEAYRLRFGRPLDGLIEIVNWRMEHSSTGRDIPLAAVPTPNDPRKGSRAVFFPGHGVLEAVVYDRYALRPGTCIDGPAVFEEREASSSFGPDCRITVDEDRNLIVHIAV